MKAREASTFVMAGLVPAIRAFGNEGKTWMPATSAGMTTDKFGLQ